MRNSQQLYEGSSKGLGTQTTDTFPLINYLYNDKHEFLNNWHSVYVFQNKFDSKKVTTYGEAEKRNNFLANNFIQHFRLFYRFKMKSGSTVHEELVEMWWRANINVMGQYWPFVSHDSSFPSVNKTDTGSRMSVPLLSLTADCVLH